MPRLHVREPSIVEEEAECHRDFIAIRGSVEESTENLLEVMVLWGSTILATKHLTEGGEVVVGDAKASIARLPEALLGAPSLVVARADARSFTMHVPEGAVAHVNGSDTQVTGPCDRQMKAGERARMVLGDFEIWVSVLSGAEKVAPVPMFERLREGGAGYIAAAGLAHGALFGVFAYHRPDLGVDADSAETSARRLVLLRQYLRASAEPSREIVEERAETERDAAAPGGGARALGAEGKLGKPAAPAANRRYGVAGKADELDPKLSRERAIAEARDFGAIGLLAMVSGDANAPTAPWGDVMARGVDPKSALGNMFGSDIGESGGMNGLGLSGTGEGGGKFQGIGLDSIGALGHFAGPPGTGPGGFGCGGGPCDRNLRSHVTRGPSLRAAGKTEVIGRLPPEVIQRVVRQSFGRFRSCYEAGLRKNPSLEGRVVTRFVIDRSGAVSHATDGGSDLPDQAVVTCVTRAFHALSFPEVEGGIVRIVYPLMFTPG